jgi:hypothetical protein
MMVLGCSGIRAVASFRTASRADLVIRGLAISFMTLARDALQIFFLVFICSIYPPWRRDIGAALPFRKNENVRPELSLESCNNVNNQANDYQRAD